jgi:hypothetical protein
VAGWERCHSKEESSAVRMVPVRAWQWQYWPRYGGLKDKEENEKKKVAVVAWQRLAVGSGMKSGSGGVGVVSFDSLEQCGENGVS